MTPDARQKRLAYFAWGAVCLIWGTTYLGIRVSLESIPPALMGGLRWLLAGSLLTIYLVARGRPLPPVSQWRGIALLGFLMLGLGNGGVVYAEQFVPSGLAAVIVATAPFWMAGGRVVTSRRREAAPIGRHRSRDWLQRDRVARLAGSDAGIREQPWLSRGHRGVAGRRYRLVDRFVLLEAPRPRGEFRRRFRQRGLGNGRLPDARRGSDHDRRRHAPRRVEHALLHHADDRGAAVPVDDWRSWRVRRLHLRAYDTCPCRSFRCTRTSTR